MRNRRGKSQAQGQTIDLTPMLDVVFIMLIFFIVTATFIKLPGPVVNEYWIDKKRVEASALKINLTRLFNENPKGGMVIQADNESNIESLAKVADIARDIGIAPVAISVEND
jgi:biopolymer transport protein ExbD